MIALCRFILIVAFGLSVDLQNQTLIMYAVILVLPKMRNWIYYMVDKRLEIGFYVAGSSGPKYQIEFN